MVTRLRINSLNVISWSIFKNKTIPKKWETPLLLFSLVWFGLVFFTQILNVRIQWFQMATKILGDTVVAAHLKTKNVKWHMVPWAPSTATYRGASRTAPTFWLAPWYVRKHPWDRLLVAGRCHLASQRPPHQVSATGYCDWEYKWNHPAIGPSQKSEGPSHASQGEHRQGQWQWCPEKRMRFTVPLSKKRAAS